MAILDLYPLERLQLDESPHRAVRPWKDEFKQTSDIATCLIKYGDTRMPCKVLETRECAMSSEVTLRKSRYSRLAGRDLAEWGS